jgi:hypothetical protein
MQQWDNESLDAINMANTPFDSKILTIGFEDAKFAAPTRGKVEHKSPNSDLSETVCTTGSEFGHKITRVLLFNFETSRLHCMREKSD